MSTTSQGRARAGTGMPDGSVDRALRGRARTAPPVTVAVTTTPRPEELARWDALVQRTQGTDVTQLSAWARVRATKGYVPLHVFVCRGPDLVGGAQLLYRRLPVVGRVGYLPYGPLVDRTVEGWPQVRRAVSEAVHEVGRERLRMLFVQPPEGGEDVSTELLDLGFRPSSADIAPPGSIRLDLTDDLATIRSRFGRKLRSWPNRWAARGVEVSLGDESDLEVLTDLMAYSGERQGFTPPPASYVETLYRELAPAGNAALFVGRVHGEPVAADLVTVCSGMIRGRLGGFRRDGEAAKLSVPAAIRWEIIRWGQEQGLRWLDFGGLSAESLEVLLGGGDPADAPSCDQPKLTFGGTAFRYPPAVELMASAPVRMAYDLVRTSPRGRAALHRAQVTLRGHTRRRSGGTEAQP